MTQGSSFPSPLRKLFVTEHCKIYWLPKRSSYKMQGPSRKQFYEQLRRSQEPSMKAFGSKFIDRAWGGILFPPFFLFKKTRLSSTKNNYHHKITIKLKTKPKIPSCFSLFTNKIPCSPGWPQLDV